LLRSNGSGDNVEVSAPQHFMLPARVENVEYLYVEQNHVAGLLILGFFLDFQFLTTEFGLPKEF
jgi:hypothetical protein